MASDAVHTFTDANFKAEVLDSEATIGRPLTERRKALPAPAEDAADAAQVDGDDLDELFDRAVGSDKSWLASGNPVLIGIGLGTLALQVWMIVEAYVAWPKANCPCVISSPWTLATSFLSN